VLSLHGMTTPSRVNRGRLSASAYATLTLVLATWLFAGSAYRGNEPDVLPVAKRFMDPTWLARDWYLGTPSSYRDLFNVPVGWLLRHFTVLEVARGGRALVMLSFVAGLAAVCRAFGVRARWWAPLGGLFCVKQSLGAGEWMVAGFETKALAYVAVVGALWALARRRLAWTAALLGLALSFHVLVGAYASLVFASALALPEQRAAWRAPWRWLGPGLLAALPGVVAVLGYLLRDGRVAAELAREARYVYVHVRVPHHVLPAHFTRGWEVAYVACAGGMAWLRTRSSPRYRLLGQLGLAAAAQFALGLVLSAAGSVAGLQLYPFRFADTALPLLSGIGVFALLSDVGRLRAGRLGAYGQALLRWFAPASLTATAVLLGFWKNRAPSAAEVRLQADLTASHGFIRSATPADARVLSELRDDAFYVEAERALFVSYKHFPQVPREIVEWRRRMLLVDPAHLSVAELRTLVLREQLDFLQTQRCELALPLLGRFGSVCVFALRERVSSR
jgi:hypothetical protein